MSGRSLFIDMNSFFASVEQQENPSLRGRPMIVSPLITESTCAIACSYEAKALGIKTGTGVKTAKRIYPDIAVVEARPHLYKEYHHRIMEVLNDLFVEVKPLSVDEMACGIGRMHASPEGEIQIAKKLKARIREHVGSTMRCSIGIAPNVFLAKVASEMQKPDGLTTLDSTNMPEALFKLHLLDLPGIATNMYARLEKHKITTVQALWEASRADLRRAWGGVVGERWWFMLRGSKIADYGAYLPEVAKTVGHSHVLPPDYRTEQGTREILLRLFSKCMKRLRSYDQAAGEVQIDVRYRHDKNFTTYAGKQRSARHLHSNDDTHWLKIVRPMLDSMPPARPGYRSIQANITFANLIKCQDMNLSLFEDTLGKNRLSTTVDALNEKHGYVVDVASVYWLHEQAPDRIPFGPIR